MTKRSKTHKEDPIEELREVYEDIRTMESEFAKTINIAQFIL